MHTTTPNRMSAMMSPMMPAAMPGMTPAMMPGAMGDRGLMPMPMPAMAAAGSMAMVPRCTVKMEKTPDGVRCVCICDDAGSAAMLQSLCSMMMGQPMGCCVMCNGMCCMSCCFTMAMCTLQMTDMGCTLTCTSGDKATLAMMHACCDCCTTCCQPGCLCCITLGNMPVCCMPC